MQRTENVTFDPICSCELGAVLDCVDPLYPDVAVPNLRADSIHFFQVIYEVIVAKLGKVFSGPSIT